MSMTIQDRRADTEVELRAHRPATLVFRLRGEEIELDATVIGATDKTLIVQLASGAGTLALATARRCELVVNVEAGEMRVIGRPGRRVGDIPLNNQIELVVTDGLDLAALL
jgi:hypothetical protein